MLKALGYKLEQLVAEHVPQAVVDVLEAIYIQKENCVLILWMLVCPVNGEFQMVREEHAIRQPRERIVKGGAVELFFGLPAYSNILRLLNKVYGLALSVKYG